MSRDLSSAAAPKFARFLTNPFREFVTKASRSLTNILEAINLSANLKEAKQSDRTGAKVSPTDKRGRSQVLDLGRRLFFRPRQGFQYQT